MTTVRRAGTVSAATLSGLALALALAQLAAPDWTSRAGLDVWNFRAAVDFARSVRARNGELRAYEDQFHQELDLADHLTDRLAAGTISLAEATDVMQPILEARAGFDLVSRTHYHAPTPRKGAARYLILRVSRLLAGDPERWAPASARLEAEYAALE